MLLCVFDCEDITRLVFDLLDFATLSAIAPVCKQFASLSKELYPIKLNRDILTPAKISYEFFFMTMRQYTITYSSTQRHTLYNLVFRSHPLAFISVLNQFEAFIRPFLYKHFWVLLLQDLDAMQTLFLFVAKINKIMLNQKAQLQLDAPGLFERIEALFDELDAYLYVENLERFISYELHEMARFKQIKKQHQMNKRQLINALQRPKNEVYHYHLPAPSSELIQDTYFTRL